jgi:hypothetical protein
MAQSAAVIALNATSGTDEYIFKKDSEFRPLIRQHSDFSQFHRVTKLPGTKFIGQTVEVILEPKELGDLMTNVYLALTMPALPTGYSYTEFIGRAIIEQVEFRIGQQIIEKITDDWYIIRDQILLDADEKLAMYRCINNGQVPGNPVTATSPFEVMIPLELFFCRRHSHGIKARQRLETPSLPLCAVLNQKISIKFFFRPQTWFTNYTTPIEFQNPRLITEEIMLTKKERLYYQTTRLQTIVNISKNDSVTNYQNGQPTHYFTADFPVTMMVWFVRNTTFTNVSSNGYYASRYTFGYTTKYITSTTPVVFFDGTTNNYIDVLESSDIYLNNRNIMGTFATGPFYQFKQPMDHGLSVPSKSLYTYCFGKSPKEYNQGGYLNFKNINSQTSKIVMTFIPGYSPNIQANYRISLYYYGYTVLQFADGKAKII